MKYTNKQKTAKAKHLKSFSPCGRMWSGCTVFNQHKIKRGHAIIALAVISCTICSWVTQTDSSGSQYALTSSCCPNNSKHAYPGAFAIDNCICSKALSVLKVGKRFDGPPGLQVTGHTHGCPHFEGINHPRLWSATTVHWRILGLKTHTQSIIHSQ